MEGCVNIGVIVSLGFFNLMIGPRNSLSDLPHGNLSLSTHIEFLQAKLNVNLTACQSLSTSVPLLTKLSVN